VRAPQQPLQALSQQQQPMQALRIAEMLLVHFDGSDE
jgi:hypothetical protein